MGSSPWGRKESTTERLHFMTSSKWVHFSESVFFVRKPRRLREMNTGPCVPVPINSRDGITTGRKWAEGGLPRPSAGQGFSLPMQAAGTNIQEPHSATKTNPAKQQERCVCQRRSLRRV